ncbi:class II aldolase/adducin family protein [Aphanothece sacrum]|uniref:Membrane protein n=1 Tax=Aphanothece sacrum FPU1 TaxID=1920663 RepID=A0A401II49_APHSA|nr:class II aldolase/adducin family protein [Aphanothece sacrum]GBF80866.1 membrane protein [Aphanothece sacrum FPU1]GBF85174.1 membrane protein [Aphanothece sacrum FPU3]
MNQTSTIPTETTKNTPYNLDESSIRIKLAAIYRLIDYFGWNDLTLTHASARLSGSESHFLINSIEFYFDQIKASNLVKIDFEGNKIDNNSLPVNPTGFVIHSAILEARPDINAVIHAHTPYGVAVSTLECGFLPIDQIGMMFHNKIAYHDYNGLGMNIEEKAGLVADLGPEKLLMIDRNHGLVVCGRTIEEAFVNLYFFESACRTQILAMSTGTKINQLSPEILDSTAKQLEKVRRPDPSNTRKPNLDKQTFDGLLKELDRIDPSYRN